MNKRTKAIYEKTFLFSLAIFISSFSCLAQSKTGIDTDISIKKMKARAKNAAAQGDIYTALFYYEEVVKSRPKDLPARYQVAELHRLSRNYIKAEEAYAYLQDSTAGSYPFALFYKAGMQKMSGKYELAKQNFLLFRKLNKNLGDKDFKRLLSQEIAGCDSGMVYREFPENVVVENLGKSVNHPHTEFSPLIIDSTNMLFGSLRTDTLLFYNTQEEFKDPQPLRQVYRAEKIDGTWKELGKFSTFNDSTMEMGNFTYSPNSGRYYFSKCSKNHKGQTLCKIYVTEKTNEGWSAPAPLPAPINLDGYTSTQPTIFYDTAGAKNTPMVKQKGRKTAPVKRGVPKKANPASENKTEVKQVSTEYLYFVSDRPEGKGGLDIWYASYNPKKKEWSTPANASAMNTSETECTPFYHLPSQTFYFSSDGFITAGGLDVYKTRREDKRFTKPQNLSFPINSPQDELGFTLDDAGKKGFFVSNRPGGTPFFHETCCDDVYAFEILPDKPFQSTLELTVKVEDSLDCKDRKIQMSVYDKKTMTSSTETLWVKDCKILLPLKPRSQYKIYSDQVGYFHDSVSLETKNLAETDVVSKTLLLRKPTEQEKARDSVNIAMEDQVVLVKDTVKVQTLQETNLSEVYGKEHIDEKPVEGVPFILAGIQYDTDSTNLNEGGQAAVDTLLIPFLLAHPLDHVDINSHTDDHGSHKYNMRLSQGRATNVVKYLISKGIDPSRVHGKGYGETKPLAPNKDANGNDNPIGRSINRRTEFYISMPKNK